MNPLSSITTPELLVVNDIRELVRPEGSRGEWRWERPWKDVVGLTLHQTATRDFAENHTGLPEVPAHALVHRRGTLSLLHHPNRVVYHGHALNGGTIGIEIACRAAGTEGDPSTFWRSNEEITGWRELKDGTRKWVGKKTYARLVAEATSEQIDAAIGLCRVYIDLVAEMGGCIRGLWAHRQGHRSRTSDPGSRIWKNVAERLRLDLGLADLRDKALGSGTPIPQEWRVNE